MWTSSIFLEFIKSDNEQNNNNNKDDKNICDKKYSEEDFWDQNILNFFKFFNIGLNLKLNIKSEENKNDKKIPNNSNTNTYDNIYFKSVKDLQKNNSNNNNQKNNNNYEGNNNNFSYDYKLKFFELNSITTLEEFNAKSEALLDFIEKIKYEIKQNKSMVIQVPFDIDKDFLISLLFLLVWKITSIDPINLLGYLKETLFYIPGIKNLSAEKLDKLLINLENVFKMPNKIDSNFLIKSSQSFYNTNKSKKVKLNSIDFF